MADCIDNLHAAVSEPDFFKLCNAQLHNKPCHVQYGGFWPTSPAL